MDIKNNNRGGSVLLSMLTLSLILAGCSVAPQYKTPETSIPAAYKEAVPSEAEVSAQRAQWKLAEPSDESPYGPWWTVFEDDLLNQLQQEAMQSNLDLKAGLARLKQARALEQNARSAQWPQVDIGIGPTRQRSPAASGAAPGENVPTTTVWRSQATLSYEADVFGRIASLADAASLDYRKNVSLFNALQLAIQADIAQAYFHIRELDAAKALFTDTVSLRQKTSELFQRRYEQGEISELDISRVKTELASAQSELLGIERQRAVAEHALATLIGRTPAEFTLPEQSIKRLSVAVPAGLPSELLERRPDIAAAERAIQAANARIGAARAAYFPRINITGALGYESNELSELFKWSSRSFLLGPVMGTMLSLPVFDGGARRANLARSEAVLEEEAARYQQTILGAFKEVEDSLSTIRLLDMQMQKQDLATQSAARAAHLSQLLYREGSASYLDVIDADRSVLQQKRVAVQLDGERARSTVNLIRALGGGWVAPNQGS